jgi:hypothetical protein
LQTLVCRATWFIELTGGKFTPVDELLAAQLEDGYAKFQPWLHFAGHDQQQTLSTDNLIGKSSNSAAAVAVASPTTPAASATGKPEKSPVPNLPQFKWNLFGPYHNYSVVYSGIICVIFT